MELRYWIKGAQRDLMVLTLGYIERNNYNETYSRYFLKFKMVADRAMESIYNDLSGGVSFDDDEFINQFGSAHV